MICFFSNSNPSKYQYVGKNIKTKERDEKKPRNKQNKTTKESGAGKKGFPHHTWTSRQTICGLLVIH